MQALLTFLNANPYMLLFLVIGLAVLIGRFTIKGYGLGTVAGAMGRISRSVCSLGNPADGLRLLRHGLRELTPTRKSVIAAEVRGDPLSVQ
ncbi:hypothetical protein ABIA48_005270 [Pseudomonas sp. S30_BP2TU TE3576]|uniref:hypothetical protein n=1 Tax=Pseudomonas sp. S30_BP2TU TE3576 TaxID=3349329 RepID=UPI003D1F04A0